MSVRMCSNSSIAIWFWIVGFTACSLQMPSENEAFGVDGGGSGAKGVEVSGGMPAGVGGTPAGGAARSGGAAGTVAASGGPSHGAMSGASGSSGVGRGGMPYGTSAGAGGGSDGGTSDGGTSDGGTSDGGTSGTVNTAGDGAGSGGASTAGAGGTGASGDHGFDPEDGLVAHFAFDEASGPVMANRKDPRRSATCSGTCTRPDGRYGRAVGIRNLPVNVDWVDLPSGLLSGLSATTLALWVRGLSTNRPGGRLFHFSGGDTEEFFFVPDSPDTESLDPGCRLAGNHSGEPFINLRIAGPDLRDERWHHVAITWSDTKIFLYIDGRSLGEHTNAGVRPSDLGTTKPDYLGRTRDDAALALHVEMDDFRIYDKALSSGDVARLYELP